MLLSFNGTPPIFRPALCDFLIVADPLFQYQWRQDPIRFADFGTRLTERMRRAAELHVRAEFPAYAEDAGDDVAP
jgi:hypothetical protein